ncbi:MAG: 3-isopropylmalate dehydrogenase [Propionibacteriaceae bacterium]|nr:3-isopropylmalate dehydrogenase [Propionibacteriaceae bacterium]
MSQQIAVIAGDGIGPEVIAQAVQILRAVDGSLSFDEFSLGATHWQASGEVLSDETLKELARYDAILLGAVGANPGSDQVPSGLLERGLLLKLRFAFDHGVNLRPARLYPGMSSPLAPRITDQGPIDFVVVREGTEGLYCGNGGVVRQGTDQEIATETSINTAFAVERVIRFAYRLAAERQQHLTLVHKHNVLVNAGGLWRRLFQEIATEFPQVNTDYLHIDAATIALVTAPSQFDVIVTDNLFGDILTDEAAAVTGGIGLAASANLNVEGAFPSMFEPVHGSAPDIAGHNLADPRAAILSGAMLLRHLGNHEGAIAIERTVAGDIAKEHGHRTTDQIGKAILSELTH